MNLGGAMFQRHAGCIEGGRGGPDDANDLTAEGGEIDCGLGMCVARARQVPGQHVRDEGAAAAGESRREDDLASGLDGSTGGRGEVQPEMVLMRLDPIHARGVSRVDAEKLLVPAAGSLPSPCA